MIATSLRMNRILDLYLRLLVCLCACGSEPFGPQPGLWSAMYLIGNPIIVWGAAVAVVVFLVLSLPWLLNLCARQQWSFFVANHACLRTCRLVNLC